MCEVDYSSSNERLLCPFWRLEAVLGKPGWVGPGYGDGKIRAQWIKEISDIGRVEIHDYKTFGPVEMIERWTLRCEPAVGRELVRLLEAVDPDRKNENLKELGKDCIFRVEKWVEIDPDQDFAKQTGLYDLPGVVGVLEQLDLEEEAEYWVGQWKYWTVLRYQTPMGWKVEVYDTRSLERVLDLTVFVN